MHPISVLKILELWSANFMSSELAFNAICLAYLSLFGLIWMRPPCACVPCPHPKQTTKQARLLDILQQQAFIHAYTERRKEKAAVTSRVLHISSRSVLLISVRPAFLQSSLYLQCRTRRLGSELFDEDEIDFLGLVSSPCHPPQSLLDPSTATSTICCWTESRLMHCS